MVHLLTLQVQNEWYNLKILARSAYQEVSAGDFFKAVVTEEDNKTTLFCKHQPPARNPLDTPHFHCRSGEGTRTTVKIIKSDHLACLKIDTPDDLMRLSVDGPSWYLFDPTAAMVAWETDRVERGHRPHYKTWPTPEEFSILRLKAS